MRLTQVIIRNFKSIKELKIRIPETDGSRQGSADFVSIVGENNVGKSSILEAIRLACPGNSKPPIDYFPQLDPSKGPIEVEFEFDRLTDRDKAEQAVRTHIFVSEGRERFHIKKVWRSPGGAPECYAYNPGARRFVFRSWPEGTTRKAFEALGTEWKAILEEADKIKKWTKPSQELFRQAAERIASPLLEEVTSEPWSIHTGGKWSNVDAVLPTVIYVPALRETSAEADVGEKQSAIRKIVYALFEQQLSRHEKVVRFRKAAADLEHLFAVEGKHKIIAQVESKITAKLSELIKISADLRFTAPDVTSDLASKTEFRVVSDDVSTRPEHQGHGAQRSIVLALLQMYAEQLREGEQADRARTLFLVEEPEIYMHPEMCRRMRDALLRIAQSDIAQVICTTHSPVFLDLADRHDGIVIVRRVGGVPVVKQRLESLFDRSTDGQERRDRLRMILNFDSAANEVFFSDHVCLVEGDSEVAAIDAIARKLDALGQIHWPAYLAARRSVTIVNCRGKRTIPAFQKVLRVFDIPYRVVYDEDTGKTKDYNGKIDQLLVSESDARRHVPNFEKQVLGGGNIDRDKPWKVIEKIRSSLFVSDELIKFFEFVLYRELKELQKPASEASFVELGSSQSQELPRRNLRAQLKTIEIPADALRTARRLEQIFRVAAGPSFTPSSVDDVQFLEISNSPASVFAIVSGDSMADTLLEGDVVALEMLEAAYLEPVDDNFNKLPRNQFGERIENGGIYVLAINDDIDRRAYTMKRVRVHELVGGGWICQICADNPHADWGERGQVDIRRVDRVHFAARVVGLVAQRGGLEPGEREVMPVFDE